MICWEKAFQIERIFQCVHWLFFVFLVQVHMSVLTHLSVAATRLLCSFLTEKKSFQMLNSHKHREVFCAVSALCKPKRWQLYNELVTIVRPTIELKAIRLHSSTIRPLQRVLSCDMCAALGQVMWNHVTISSCLPLRPTCNRDNKAYCSYDCSCQKSILH